MAEKKEANIPVIKGLLIFLNKGFLLAESFSTRADANLIRRCIREQGEYTKRLRRVLDAESYGWKEERRNSFLVIFKSEGKKSRLRFAKISLLSCMRVK